MTGMREERDRSRIPAAGTRQLHVGTRPDAGAQPPAAGAPAAGTAPAPAHGALRPSAGRTRRTSRRAWSGTTLGVAAVVALVVVGNLIWIVHDHQAPPWDQAHYLHLTWQWRRALTDGGLRRAVSAFYNTDPAYPPLYMLAITPFEALRNGVDAALVANTLMLAGTIVTVAAIAARLFGRRAAIPAAIFVGTAPVIYGLSRTVLVDTLVVLLAALTVLAAIASNGFQDRRWAVACGVFAGLATLTKMTAPGIVLAPALLTLAWPQQITLRRQLTNAAIAVAVAVVVALAWYTVNLNPALDYLRSTTNGQLAIGTTTSPLNLHAFLEFLVVTIDSGIGTILLVVAVVAAALSARRLRSHIDRRGLIRLAIPASWFLIPFVVLAVSHNQDIRYLAPGIAGVAVLAAGAVAAIRPAALRRVVLGAAAVVLAVQFAAYLTPAPGTGVGRLAVGSRTFQVTVPLDGSRLADTRRPGVPDYATPIVRALAAARTAGRAPLDVCLLESQQVVNGNTLGYVGESRGVALTFTDLSYLPHVGAAALAATLSQCPVALYIPGDSGTGRVGLLNRSSAAARITPTELGAFNGPRRRFPVGDGLSVQLLRRAP